MNLSRLKLSSSKTQFELDKLQLSLANSISNSKYNQVGFGVGGDFLDGDLDSEKNDNRKWWLMRNSWSKDWGVEGIFKFLKNITN